MGVKKAKYSTLGQNTGLFSVRFCCWCLCACNHWTPVGLKEQKSGRQRWKAAVKSNTTSWHVMLPETQLIMTPWSQGVLSLTRQDKSPCALIIHLSVFNRLQLECSSARILLLTDACKCRLCSISVSKLWFTPTVWCACVCVESFALVSVYACVYVWHLPTAPSFVATSKKPPTTTTPLLLLCLFPLYIGSGRIWSVPGLITRCLAERRGEMNPLVCDIARREGPGLS